MARYMGLMERSKRFLRLALNQLHAGKFEFVQNIQKNLTTLRVLSN